MNDDIKIECRGPATWILFNRAEANGAVRLETMQALCSALDEAVDDDETHAIFLGSTGKHFVTGAEFAFLDRLAGLSTAEVARDIYRYFQGAARRLYHCPKPTVAVVSGAAITVGCELALACDFRIVTPDAMFQESWIKLGLLPPLGGMKLLPALVGLGMANEMILRGRAVRGEEAVRIGLANELVDPDNLKTRTDAWAAELAAAAPRAYAEAKAGLHRGLESSMDLGWRTDVMAQSMLIGGGDFREGLSAVKEKRSPRFVGA